MVWVITTNLTDCICWMSGSRPARPWSAIPGYTGYRCRRKGESRGTIIPEDPFLCPKRGISPTAFFHGCLGSQACLTGANCMEMMDFFCFEELSYLFSFPSLLCFLLSFVQGRDSHKSVKVLAFTASQPQTVPGLVLTQQM